MKIKMARKRQDEFKSKVIELLRKRSANRCSHPECKKLTTSPQIANSSKVNDTGIAAHIAAASENGPRYDKTMTSEQRSSIDNAIWLCSHHATIIDREPESYPVEMLKEWKKNNESQIFASVNEPFLTNLEVNQHVANKMLNSIGIDTSSKISTSINTLAKSIEDIVTKLDPRVSVQYSYDNGIDNFKINAISNESDPVKIFIKPKDNFEYSDMLNKLINHGIDFSSELSNFSTNSPGLSYIFPKSTEGAVLKVTNKKREKLIVEFEDDNENQLVVTNGEIIFGKLSFSVNSSALDGMFEFNIEKYEINNINNKENIKLTLNFSEWYDKDVCELKCFERVFKLYNKISKSKFIKVSLCLDNNESVSINLDTDVQFFKNIVRQLEITDISRKLSKFLGCKFLFSNEYTLSDDGHEFLLRIYNEIVPVEKDGEFEHIFYIETDDDNVVDVLRNGIDIKYEIPLSLNRLNLFGEILDRTIYIQYEIIQPKFKYEKIKSENGTKFKVTCSSSGQDSKFVRTVSLEPILTKLLNNS